MNLMDGGKNRVAMRGIGMRGLRSVLQERHLWVEGMHLDEARKIMWEQEDVKAQKSRIEQLFYDHGMVLGYQSKAHPLMDPAEVDLIINY